MSVVFFLALCFLLAGSVYLNIRWIRMLMRIEDNCQEALEYMDLRYQTINNLLHESHLVEEDQIARQFVDEIKLSLNGILYAANILKDPSVGSIEDLAIEEPEKEEEKESEQES